MHSSPRMRPTLLTDSPKLEPIPEPKTTAKDEHNEGIKKSSMRVDAFLGEWLSPDYFELITPPPSSVMMVAGAKADLLRREDTSSLISSKDMSNPAPPQPFPGGWGSPIIPKGSEEPGSPAALLNMSAMAQALSSDSMRDRTGSLGSIGSIKSLKRFEAAVPEHGVYAPPIPSYAISSSDPIPQGYVAHARDACVDVDYQWDSMRDPQNWPNGGEYGEEWSSMHKRFRKGLQQMVRWYEGKDGPGEASVHLDVKGQPKAIENRGEDEDEETELVVILVTHGAGCNALIGALTNQPVLLSVGMASLTMAVRKPDARSREASPAGTPAHTPKQHSRVSSKVLGVSDEYDVKLVANTDHLRPSAPSTPSLSRQSSVSGAQSTFRPRYVGSSGMNGVDGITVGEPTRSMTVSAGLGSMRRTNSTATSHNPRPFVPIRQGSVGLWNPQRAPSPTSEAESPSDNMMLNFANSPLATPPLVENVKKDEVAQVMDEVKEIQEKEGVDIVAPLGLWGAPRPPGEAESRREMGAKRRWTVTEAGQ